jgi:hypothetical protein
MDLQKTQIEWAEKNLGRQIDWIGRVDVKAGILLGTLTAMLGVLFGINPKVGSMSTAQQALSLITLLILGGGCVYVLLTQFPRTAPPTEKAPSLLFFGTICARASDAYLREFKSMTPEQYLDDLLRQAHRNGEIVQSKFENLQIGYTLFWFGLLFWLLAVYLAKG